MASPAAADPSRAMSQARTSAVDLSTQQATKKFVMRDFDLTIRAYFPPPTAYTKFNPISAMTTLFRTMLKDESSLVLCSLSNDTQLILAKDSLPIGEKEFKKFFKVSATRSERQNPSHVCIGCQVLSNRSLSHIKFQSKEGHLLAWLKQQRIFLESDGLGTDCPVTIGYFTKIAADLTHLANFRDHLANQLMLVDIDSETAIALAPHLKEAQSEAMSNGDECSILPEFEVYRTHLTHGRAPSQVKTDVLGVKCAPRDAKLLNEILTRMATTSTDQRDGVFVPKGAAHLLGPNTYEQILKDHNFFLTTVATVPINLEYRAWFALIDPTNASETDPTSLYDHLLRKSWFLRIEEVDRRKCLIITTKPNLPEARAWMDNNLEPLIRKSIPEGIDPPASQLPRRLDKPVYSATSQTYADVLKKQFSIASNATTTTADHTHPPPRKRHAVSIIDYDSDKSTNSPSANVSATKTPTPLPTVDYAAELQLIKTELAALRTLVHSAVEQMKSAVESFTTHTPVPARKMEIENDHVTDHSTETPPELSDLITELKNDIATIGTEMREKFKELHDAQPKPIPFQLPPFPTFPK